jgi:hypothetical protein
VAQEQERYYTMNNQYNGGAPGQPAGATGTSILYNITVASGTARPVSR